jgi:Cu-processing system permease protein
MQAIKTIAWREMRDTLYSRWLIGFGALFALLTVGISYYGLAGAREVGFQGFNLVAASVLNLILFTVPMVAMIQAALNLAHDDDGLSILLTQPLSRSEALLGKYLGMAGALLATILGGLSLGGLVVMIMTSAADAGAFALLMALTAVLIVLFLAIGTLIATRWRERTKALGISLSLWFILVILYDLGIFGVAVAGAGMPLRTLFLIALAGNPVDSVRVMYLLATGTNGFVGPTGAVLAETLGSPLGLTALTGMLCLWTVGSLGAATWVLRHKDL